MHFDVIPRAVDEYHQQLRAFPDQPIDQQVNNPVWHIHAGKPPVSRMVVSFGMLLNLASVSGAKDASALWKFLQRYAPDATPETHPDLDAAAGYAVRYFADKIAPTRVFREPDAKERAAMEDLVQELKKLSKITDASNLVQIPNRAELLSDEGLQSLAFAVGKKHGFEPLRDWFKALYEVLLGASDGPRFGGFIALYGVDETVALMERALKGELVA
jgi:lysyl-tRNA synthetase class 1